jgi:hypothetical protein
MAIVTSWSVVVNVKGGNKPRNPEKDGAGACFAFRVMDRSNKSRDYLLVSSMFRPGKTGASKLQLAGIAGHVYCRTPTA